jgi:RNA polymerase sigma-70 factor (ECF subfamily)
LDYLRKESKWKMDELADNDMTEESDIDWEGIDMKVDIVKKAILNLPTGFRTVASLFLIEGYEHKEIATILSISENTSKSQFHRAKRKIKEYLKESEAVNDQPII